MPCYRPMLAFYPKAADGSYLTNPNTGKNKVVVLSFVDASKVLHKYPAGLPDNYFYVPCGQCIGCRLEYSRQWAVRCIHEAQMHKQNCFITLTYAPEFLPEDRGLHVEDFQKFMKRFRKAVSPLKIRFFHCGEYGTKLSRPHYHAIIFGFDFPDKRLKFISNGYPVYTSELLQKLWPFGISSVAGVTFESCAYVARYILKKQKGKDEDGRIEKYYDGRAKEYVTMSRRPGIGASWFDRYATDVYPADDIVTIRSHHTVYHSRPPRYYDTLLSEYYPELFEYVKSKRDAVTQIKQKKLSYRRLTEQEQLKGIQVRKLIRPLHVT